MRLSMPVFSWRRLWLESDSTYLVALLRSRFCWVPWRWRPVWERCVGSLSQMDFVVTHINQKGKQVVDCLVFKAPSIVAPTRWWTASVFCSFF